MAASCQERAAKVPAASAARPPQQKHTQREQRQPGRGEREAGPVVAAYAHGTGMGDRKCRAFESERTESEGDEGTKTDATRAEQARGRRQQRECGESGNEMVARGNPRLGSDERVGNRVDGDQQDSGGKEPLLARPRGDERRQPADDAATLAPIATCVGRTLVCDATRPSHAAQ